MTSEEYCILALEDYKQRTGKEWPESNLCCVPTTYKFNWNLLVQHMMDLYGYEYLTTMSYHGGEDSQMNTVEMAFILDHTQPPFSFRKWIVNKLKQIFWS